MKKITTLFAFMMLASIAFTSCDSVTSDAKKSAQNLCKIQELMKDDGYTKNKEEIKKLKREREDIMDKYKTKMKDMTQTAREELAKKFDRAFEDEKDKCKD